jgi:ATP/maltotriose-dependent transcriptional regulator MalT
MIAREDHRQRPRSSTPTLRVATRGVRHDDHSYGITEYLRLKNDSVATPHGASSLTTAELRLLPLLSTHLTLDEIGERLHVTRNTVKTQAIAIYRKFGVSSRRSAISRMHELGLLPHN